MNQRTARKCRDNIQRSPTKMSGRFRSDRAVTVGLVHPLRGLLRSSTCRSIPILMYHGIRDGFRDGHPYFETNTHRDRFAEHMKLLRDQGIVPVHLDEAVRALNINGNDGQKRVVITFDDGCRDFYTEAYPILREYGFKATMFIVSGRTTDSNMTERETMSWTEIREVAGHDIEIGSHTVSHPTLYSLPLAGVEHEIAESKDRIEQMLGRRVTSFSYPFAFPEQDRSFVASLKSMLVNHGYETGVSTTIGTATSRNDPYFLPRLPANSYDDARLFSAKLSGSYDWVHFPQRLYKALLKPLVAAPREVVNSPELSS